MLPQVDHLSNQLINSAQGWGTVSEQACVDLDLPDAEYLDNSVKNKTKNSLKPRAYCKNIQTLL